MFFMAGELTVDRKLLYVAKVRRLRINFGAVGTIALTLLCSTLIFGWKIGRQRRTCWWSHENEDPLNLFCSIPVLKNVNY